MGLHGSSRDRLVHLYPLPSFQKPYHSMTEAHELLKYVAAALGEESSLRAPSALAHFWLASFLRPCCAPE